jgi:hypothetical protein
MRVSRAENRRHWQERLARFAASNLGVAQFCAQEGVSTASFYQWRRREQAAASTAANTGVSQALAPRFLPLTLAPGAPSALFADGRALDLELPNQVRLRMPRDIEAQFVGQLLTTMAVLGPGALVAPRPEARS